ncbi:Glycosyltransferase 61 [uncultured Caudovirales phage]|uniref:Glycosyltransferase 61 n=1 Tax=uncultured Caudovirales phage TaxID=2100421 RepID=A0A6J7WNE7_9CAUD|nr:Glycosyltransferase 61 [uncultured Caudovirales phage]
MITRYRSFDDLKNDYFDEKEIKIIIDNKYGTKTFIAPHSFVNMKENMENTSIVKYENINNKESIKNISATENSFNFVLNASHPPYQIFHALFCNVFIINSILKKVNHLNIYVSNSFYDKYLFEDKRKEDHLKIRNLFTDYLKFLGIEDRVSFISLEEGYYKIENCINFYINDSISYSFEISHGDVVLLKNFYKENKSKSNFNYKKIYLRRNNGYSRTPHQEKLLSEYFEELGFVSVQLQEYEIPDQIAILDQAEIIAGFSGSAFTNLVFSSDKKMVIELTYTPDTTSYYEINNKDFGNLQNSAIEMLNIRYSFNWSNLLNLFNHNVLKIEFPLIDNCSQAVEILKQDKYFNHAINVV